MNNEKEKLQEKYDNLSLEERNAYEQIIDRHKPKGSWLEFPFFFLKLLTFSGVFFIITALLTEVPIPTFGESYMQIAIVFIIATPLILTIGITFSILDRIKINKLKRKLLNK